MKIDKERSTLTFNGKRYDQFKLGFTAKHGLEITATTAELIVDDQQVQHFGDPVPVEKPVVIESDNGYVVILGKDKLTQEKEQTVILINKFKFTKSLIPSQTEIDKQIGKLKLVK